MTEFHDDENMVILTDEDGVEHEFELLDVLNVDEQDYAILAMPESEEDAVVLRIEQNDEGSHVLVDIEDEDEWNRVAEAWEQVQDEEMEDWDDQDETADGTEEDS